jgi:hypothetical protein
MAFGPGKYDDLCTEVRNKTKARGAIVIIIDGEHGSGFSCQADLMVTLMLPEILEDMAKQIRESKLISRPRSPISPETSEGDPQCPPGNRHGQ